jgi:hypothetical protein
MGVRPGRTDPCFAAGSCYCPTARTNESGVVTPQHGLQDLAQLVGQFGSQDELIQTTEHPSELLPVAGVQRHPAAVVGLHLGRHHDVGGGCGSSAREVVWRNIAIDKPWVSTW